MKIPRHARMQRNLNRVTFTFQEMKEENFASVSSIARVQMKLGILIVQSISTTANFLYCRTILFFPMHFVSLLNARAPHRIKFYSTQLSMLFYGWISKRERRILRIQILVISNTNGNIFNRWSLFRPGALKTDLLNFRWIFQTEFVRVGVLKTHLLPRDRLHKTFLR